MNRASVALLDVDAFARGFLEAVEHLGRTWPRISAAALADVGRLVARAAVVAPEVDAAREAGGTQEPPELVAVTPEAKRSSAISAGVSSPFGLALLAGEHLLRPEDLDGLAVYRVVQRDGPEDVLALLLAARAQLGREGRELLAVFGELDLEHHVAVVTSRP